jgi:hypothetical protein
MLLVPVLEEVTHWETEAGKNLLVVQPIDGAKDVVVVTRIANSHELFIGMDDSCEGRVPGQDVKHASLKLGTDVPGREGFHRESGCTGRRPLGVGLSSGPVEAVETFQSEVDGFADLRVPQLILGINHKVAVADLREPALLGQGLWFGFCPAVISIPSMCADGESAGCYALTAHTVAEVLILWTC